MYNIFDANSIKILNRFAFDNAYNIILYGILSDYVFVSFCNREAHVVYSNYKIPSIYIPRFLVGKSIDLDMKQNINAVTLENDFLLYDMLPNVFVIVPNNVKEFGNIVRDMVRVSKYITTTYKVYNSSLVADLKSFVNNDFKKCLNAKKKFDKELNIVIVESNKKRMPVVLQKYKEQFDNYCNYVYFLLEKSECLDKALDIVRRYYADIDDDILLDLAVVIISSIVREQMKNK